MIWYYYVKNTNPIEYVVSIKKVCVTVLLGPYVCMYVPYYVHMPLTPTFGGDDINK